MLVINFQLFRTKLHFPRQHHLFEDDIDRGNMLRHIIFARPSAELRRGFTWHLGNVTEIDDSGIYFAIGRTTTQSIELWDEEHKAYV